MKYSVELGNKAAKVLRGLPKRDLRSIQVKIDALKANPSPRGMEKLVGIENYSRISIGDYRIIYIIQDAVLLIFVINIDHRKEIYKQI